MNILITGCAGFIGYYLADKLLLKKKNNIYGIDCLNKYYSQKLKKKRLSFLLKKKNFKFTKLDLSNKKKLEIFFSKNKIDIIFNLAAQAGVRYVKSKPEKFIYSNILGFHNLIDVSNKHKIKKFFYASSSSVYGDKTTYPVSENTELSPKNIYGLSKKFNEDYVNINFEKSTKYIGLRFFTVYGEWGRPDMLIIKFLDHVKKNKKFYLNENGNHWRDFTHVNDVVNMCDKLINKNFKQNEIFNICSGKPYHIKAVVNYLSKKKNFKKIIPIKKNEIEVKKTHGRNSKILKYIGKSKFENLYKNIDLIIKWYDKYNNLI